MFNRMNKITEEQNTNRGINAWSRLTAGRRVGEEGLYGKGEGRSQRTHIWVTHRHRQQCGDGQRGGGSRLGGGGQMEEMGTSARVAKIKIKLKTLHFEKNKNK